MLNNVNTNIERIIAKIDNDFNPDNSDWIPRVAAWCIDAMSQIGVLSTKRKKIKLAVIDRIVYSHCPINNNNIKVYDNNNCLIEESDRECECSNVPSTGEFAQSNIAITTNTVSVANTKRQSDYVIAETINDKLPNRYNVYNYKFKESNCKRNYVIVDNNKLELNFDTDYIYIELDYIETYDSKAFNCELPVIPNNGILIEAIAYFCIYKMLCRGYKHPVFNLNATQYGSNPYYMWTQLKDEAKRSIINNSIDEDASKLMRSNLFIETFDTRR